MRIHSVASLALIHAFTLLVGCGSSSAGDSRQDAAPPLANDGGRDASALCVCTAPGAGTSSAILCGETACVGGRSLTCSAAGTLTAGGAGAAACEPAVDAGTHDAGPADVGTPDSGSEIDAASDAVSPAPGLDASSADVTCIPTCDGESCGGDDGCHHACGCLAPSTCGGGGDVGACGCTPDCASKACGADDSCGGSCQTGSCVGPLTCGGAGQAGVCGCTPSCSGQACGADDSCGGTCLAGSCPNMGECVNGACLPMSCGGVAGAAGISTMYALAPQTDEGQGCTVRCATSEISAISVTYAPACNPTPCPETTVGCVGEDSCVITVDNTICGNDDPCPGVAKGATIALTCAP